ncbi:hypothetical protein JD844_031612 [Phrynosoma platyrhinos]|uniref:Uncharacterized protein n=1 Tax=Phrynosoma platyrhinos TaxID=52577 RepID=A0ABQ7T1D9_PHRPL|nr:hypothetical protein JD844_031612 [Phrynosoma platyrhinos]
MRHWEQEAQKGKALHLLSRKAERDQHTMEEFTGGEVYQKEFSPQAYLEYYKFAEGTLGNEAIAFYMECLCKTFASGGLLPAHGYNILVFFKIMECETMFVNVSKPSLGVEGYSYDSWEKSEK